MFNDWNTFFSAILATTGTLLGLLFVGIALNVTKIIASPNLFKAARQPMFLLLGLLVASLFFLIPGQSIGSLGVETLAVGTVFTAITVINDYSVFSQSPKSKRARYLSNIITNSLPLFLVVLSGIAMIVYGVSGIYVMVAAVVLAFIQAATMSWALVVDISMQGNGRRWFDDPEKPTDT